jgi:hypothetical protein
MKDDGRLRPDMRLSLLFTLVSAAGFLVIVGVLCILRACDGS